MDYSGVADRYEFYAGSFTLDFYTQALRRFIKLSVLNGQLGIQEKTPIDPFFVNRRPLAQLLGESNRLYIRYPLIKALLEDYKAGHLNSPADCYQTHYFNCLYANFKSRSLVARYRGKKSCVNKTLRVLRICDWLELSDGDFSGLTSFLSGDHFSKRIEDYPLALKLDNNFDAHSFVQLDGSHRRSVSAFLGYKDIVSTVVSLESLNLYISQSDDQYICAHWPVFVDFLQALDLCKFSAPNAEN